MLKYVSVPLLVLCLVVAGCDETIVDPKPVTAIEGQIVNAATDAPLGSATVTTIPTTTSLTTTAEGRFVLEGIDPGDYTVIAKAPGYISNTVEITVQDGQRKQVTISLEEKAEDEEPIARQGPIMPLALGNTWTFEHRTENGDLLNSYKFRLADTRQIDGKKYYQLLLNYGDDTATNQYVTDSTANGERVGTILLALNTGGQTQFFKYPVEDGATYEYTEPSGETHTYTVVKETIEVPAGTFVVYTYSGYGTSPENTFSFAPGIGPIRLTYSDGSASVLQDCETQDYSCGG